MCIRDRCEELGGNQGSYLDYYFYNNIANQLGAVDSAPPYTCLLYTSDAADERSSVDLGGRRIIKKKRQT